MLVVLARCWHALIYVGMPTPFQDSSPLHPTLRLPSVLEVAEAEMGEEEEELLGGEDRLE